MHDTAVATPSGVGPPLALRPFRAWRLGPAQLGDPASARLFARPYRKVAGRLDEWNRRGFVHRDTVPGLYVHEYSAGGLTIRGLVGALELSRVSKPGQPDVVLPHEGVHPTQVRDLVRRMDEMHLNPAPILLVRHGGGRAASVLADVLAGPPTASFEDRGGQGHRLWHVTDATLLEQLDNDLAPGEALVADGHHRFAAYLDLHRAHPGTAWARGLAMVVDQDDTPLHLGAIHRTLDGTTWDQLCTAVTSIGGRVLETDRAGALDRLAHDTLVLHDGQRWAALSLPIPRDDLAVCSLHASVIPALTPAPTVGYQHTVHEALEKASPRTLALILPTPDFDIVLAHGRQRRLLPEKATSFQPKPHVGTLMRSLRDE